MKHHSDKNPRKSNWLVGLVMFLIIIGIIAYSAWEVMV